MDSTQSSSAAAQASNVQAPAALNRRTLYPAIEPYMTGTLQVSDVHTMYYEQSGNPSGVPVAVIHGGPGGGSDGWTRSFFDPQYWRIILWDQRGCGKSVPTACLIDNTTQHLIADAEQLREHLGIERWHLFGGSWGSTLSLALAQAHPSRCQSLVLRGIFLLRKVELDWFYENTGLGAQCMFPDFFQRYLEVIPETERGNMIEAYYKRLTGDDEKVKVEAARSWSVWEMSTSRLIVDPAHIRRADSDAEFAVMFARIECHYFINKGFFSTDGQLLTEARKLAAIPTTIVQARYDMVCPFMSAWLLHRAMPHAEFRVVDDAGHSAKEQGVIHELVSATDRYKSLSLSSS